MTAHVEIPSEQFLLDAVKGLSPTRELFAGKKYLEMMIKEKGVLRTIDFINKILDILDDEEGLNQHIHFDEDELALFNKASFNGYTRRNFLRTYAWGLCGTAFLAGGVLGTSINLAEYFQLRQPEADSAQKNPDALAQSHRFVLKHVIPPAEILCGAALIYENYDKLIELKLDQVAWAVTKFADKIHEKYPSVIIQP